MNDREKKLLVLVGIIVFLILNLAAWSLVYSPRKKAAESKETETFIGALPIRIVRKRARTNRDVRRHSSAVLLCQVRSGLS